MFVIGSKKDGFQVHLDARDMVECLTVGENIRVTLSVDKAKELEDRLEKSLKGSCCEQGD